MRMANVDARGMTDVDACGSVAFLSASVECLAGGTSFGFRPK